MKVSLVLASLFASALAAPSFTSQYELDGGNNRREGGSLIDRLREDKRFSRFVEVLEKERGLRDDLENRDMKSTVWAPTNDAIERMEEEWREQRDEDRPAMRDVLRYHIAGDSQITRDCLHAGALIPTNLRMKTLEDRHQRIRVFRFADTIFLNARARVMDKEIEAENGQIFPIDHVLCPPQNVVEMLGAVPTRLSTTLAAFARTGLDRDLTEEKGVTVFAASNNAWEKLGYENLRYLFSCAGQKTWAWESKDRRGRDENQEGRVMCNGIKDLKKILQGHIAKKVAYTTDVMKDEKMQLPTLGHKKITVCARKRQGGGSDEDRNRRDEDSNKHRNVNHYNFVVNDGEARVAFTDGLSSNGAIQVIDSVICSGVRLPHERV